MFEFRKLSIPLFRVTVTGGTCNFENDETLERAKENNENPCEKNTIRNAVKPL